MTILISEKELRQQIREALQKEGLFSNKRRSDKGEGYVTTLGKNKGGYEGPLVTVKGRDKYIGDPSIGLSASGFWEGFRKALEEHINKAYPKIKINIEDLGITRDLAQAANAEGNPDRVSGSKHGCGLAQDVKMHTEMYGQYEDYKTMNKKLAEDEVLVNAIREFMAKSENSDLVWGGAFDSGSDVLQKGKQPSGRGITEFHHFEFKDSKMPAFFSKHESELEKLGMKSSELTSTTKLGELYNKLL